MMVEWDTLEVAVVTRRITAVVMEVRMEVMAPIAVGVGTVVAAVERLWLQCRLKVPDVALLVAGPAPAQA